MAASYDAAGSGAFSEATGVSFGITISASATLLIVYVPWSETTPSANGMIIGDISIAGTSLTFNSQIVNGYVLESWYLASPPTGARTITITWIDSITLGAPSGGVSGYAMAATFISTDTSFPIVRTTTRTAFEEQRQVIGDFVPARVSDAVTTIQAASAANFLCDAVVASSRSVTPTVTVDSNQNERAHGGGTGADGSNFDAAESTRKSAASKIPMRWDMSDFVNFAQTVIEVKGV